ncbi:MAG TPA: DUF1579 family protein [Candidatus Krumholzibacteria bacterium]|nr:DUF1579 family protein [Candidatus Krumholzibacteria bacterium]
MRLRTFAHESRPAWIRIFAVVTLTILSLSSVPVLAQDEAGQGEMPPMGPPAQMKEIAFMQGEWTVDMQVKMDPSADWQSYKGEATVAPTLDGCMQRMDFASEFMGMPFKGIGLDTFNRETGQYESYWIDTMSAHMSMMAGDFEDGKLTMSGEDMQMGQHVLTKAWGEKKGEDEVYWEMSLSPDQGKTWMTNMKMTYHRKK